MNMRFFVEGGPLNRRLRDYLHFLPPGNAESWVLGTAVLSSTKMKSIWQQW